MAERTTEEPNRRTYPWRDFVFPPVRNGLDYLVTAVEYLRGGATPPDSRSLKYAVLHLQAATEVLLKARLVEEHWSLVFDNPGTATLKKYEEGDFESCSMTAALDRLEHIAKVDIKNKHRDAIKKLAKTRNALTHFAYTKKGVDAYAVENVAAEIMGYLLNFIHECLRPMLFAKSSDDTRDVEHTLADLRAKLGDIPSLVKYRMGELAQELAEMTDRTVMCPDCRQWALVIGKLDPFDNEPLYCRFCLQIFDLPVWAEADYTSLVLDRKGNREYAKCPTCAQSMVLGARTAADPTKDIALCFRCGAVAKKTGR